MSKQVIFFDMRILKRYFFTKGLNFALQIIFFFVYKGLKDKILHDMTTQAQIELARYAHTNLLLSTLGSTLMRARYSLTRRESIGIAWRFLGALKDSISQNFLDPVLV